MDSVTTITNPPPKSAALAEGIAQVVMDQNLATKWVSGHVDSNETVGVKMDPALVDKAVQAVREHLDYAHRKLDYSVHQDSNQIVVRVEDRETGKVLREIPDTEFLDLVSHLEEMVGFVINKNA